MFSGLNKFVADLEASVTNGGGNPLQRAASFSDRPQTGPSPVPIRPSPQTHNSQSSFEDASPSALAEQGFHALRRSITKGAQQVKQAGKGSLEIVRQSSFSFPSSPPTPRAETGSLGSIGSYGFPPIQTPPRNEPSQAHLFAIGSDATSRANTPFEPPPERAADGSIIPQLAILPPSDHETLANHKSDDLAFFRAVNLALPGDQLEIPVTPAESPSEEHTEEQAMGLPDVFEAASPTQTEIIQTPRLPQVLETELKTPTMPATIPSENNALEEKEALPINGTTSNSPQRKNATAATASLPPSRSTTPPIEPIIFGKEPLNGSPISRSTGIKHSLPPVNTSAKHGSKPSLGRLPERSIQSILMSPTSPTTPNSEANRLRNQLDGLRAVLTQQNDRMKELRESHQLENVSMREELATLREKQQKHNAEVVSIKQIAEEEQEKRSKSISLLKAIRQKLLQAESAKTEMEKALAQERELSRQERNKWDTEISQVRAEKDSTISKIRTAFERELTTVRSNAEAEINARRGQAELDALTTKAAHAKELKSRRERVQEVEKRLLELEEERNTAHDDGQTKAAELDSARTWASTLEARISEQQVQLQEAEHRQQQLQESLTSLQTRMTEASPKMSSADEIKRQATFESDQAHFARVSSLERQVKQLEAERQTIKDEMALNMELRLSEVERMRSEISKRDGEYAQNMQEADRKSEHAEAAEAKVHDLTERARELEGLLETVQQESERAISRQEAIREDLKDRDHRISELEGRIEEVLSRETQTKAANKMLREELRKVSSGVLMAEKARNPGVGYFSSFNGGTSTPHPQGSVAGSVPSTPLSPPASLGGGILSSQQQNQPTHTKDEEAVNFEYIRNVILQFVEHREMRVHLVGVLAVILHFTPQEQRRLSAKANS